jgi:hypothetical protein
MGRADAAFGFIGHVDLCDQGSILGMRPSPDIMIPISGIIDESHKGIQVVVRATNKTAWLPKDHLGYLPGAVLVPVWLARKLKEGWNDESMDRRSMATSAGAQGDPARP